MDSLKICTVCLFSKPISDYINKNDKCYKCVYAEKIALLGGNDIRLKPRKPCKMCKKTLPNQRWTYCTQECARKAKKESRHWTVRFRGDTKDWRKRFIF